MNLIQKNYLSHENEEPFCSSCFKNLTTDESNGLKRISALINYYKNCSWLTIGDGRYGEEGVVQKVYIKVLKN